MLTALDWPGNIFGILGSGQYMGEVKKDIMFVRKRYNLHMRGLIFIFFQSKLTPPVESILIGYNVLMITNLNDEYT